MILVAGSTDKRIYMTNPISSVDPDGLLEYSVVFTDRSLNHMSSQFQDVMNDISSTLKSVYNAHSVVLVPGGGTYAMEAVARQFGENKQTLIVRNGWFSFRWSQIIETGSLSEQTHVLTARQIQDGNQAPFAPAPIEEVVAAIEADKPDIVYAPHVETSSGMMLPDSYLKAIGDAVKATDGLFVLDCIASGTMWVDMKDCGVDILISAPQKGWSASPCCGVVMLSEKARQKIDSTRSSSFAIDLAKWLQIMEAYESGGHAYHATMPTDGIRTFRDAMKETETMGFAEIKQAQQELGDRVRALLAAHGFESVAAEGFQAPGVVVCYTDDSDIQNGKKFLSQGLQIAAGVPLQCNEPESFSTFRIGLFGLDKLKNIDRTVDNLKSSLEGLQA